MNRIAQSTILVPLLACLVLATVAIPSTDASGTTVTIKNRQFTPTPVKVVAGTTVTWVNRDVSSHQVISNDGLFPKSPILKPGMKYSVRITKIGTVNYHDGFDGFMEGTLYVVKAPTTSATPRPTVKATPRPTAAPTAKATSKPSVKPTAKPAVKATAPPTASTSPAPSSTAMAGGGIGGLDDGAGPSGGADALPAGSSGGPSSLGLALLLLALVGAAFVGGFLIATRRREPSTASGAVGTASASGVVPDASPAPSVGPAAEPSAPGAEGVLAPSGSSGAFQMPYDVDEDAPLQNTPPPRNRPD